MFFDICGYLIKYEMTEVNPGEGSSKMFVEAASCRIINGMFYLNMRSGTEESSFVFPLPLAKGMSEGFAQQIEEIEKQIGQKIPSGISQGPVVSPWSTPPDDQKKK